MRSDRSRDNNYCLERYKRMTCCLSFLEGEETERKSLGCVYFNGAFNDSIVSYVHVYDSPISYDMKITL